VAMLKRGKSGENPALCRSGVAQSRISDRESRMFIQMNDPRSQILDSRLPEPECPSTGVVRESSPTSMG